MINENDLTWIEVILTVIAAYISVGEGKTSPANPKHFPSSIITSSIEHEFNT